MKRAIVLFVTVVALLGGPVTAPALAGGEHEPPCILGYAWC